VTPGIPKVVTVDDVEMEIKITDFGVTQKESRALFKNGVQTAQRFLETWNFEEWKKQYRQNTAQQGRLLI
jgi:NTE family protein